MVDLRMTLRISRPLRVGGRREWMCSRKALMGLPQVLVKTSVVEIDLSDDHLDGTRGVVAVVDLTGLGLADLGLWSGHRSHQAEKGSSP